MSLKPWSAPIGAVGLLLILGSWSAPVWAEQDLQAVLNQTNQFVAAGNYDAALVQAKKLEAGIKAKFGANHPSYVIALNQLLRIYAAQGKYADAEADAVRALAIRQKALGPADATVAESQINLAGVYKLEGRYPQAEDLYQHALATQQKLFAPDNPELANNLNDFGALYQAEGKYPQAEELLQRALSIREKAAGPGHPLVAETLGNIAIVYLSEGEYARAEDSFKRALAIQQKALGADHPNVAATVNNLAEVYRAEAKYAEAEPLYQRALAIDEKTLGPQHPSVALALRNLAELYREQGNYTEAEALYQRALAINEKVLGANHPETGATINNFAGLYVFEGKYQEADALYQRGLKISQSAFGPDHPDVATFAQNLAFVDEAEGKHAEAEAGFQHALAIRENALGPGSPEVAASLVGLGTVFAAEGKFAQADASYQRALTIEQNDFGPDHPNVAQLLLNLALLNDLPGGNAAQALKYARKASAAELAYMAQQASTAEPSTELGGGGAQRSDFFRTHVANLALVAKGASDQAPALGHEALEMAQRAAQSGAAAAVQQMAARFGGSNGLGVLVRQRQDLSVAWQNQNKNLIDAESKPQAQQDLAGIDAARKQLADTQAKLAANAAQLDKEFPDYVALTNPKPLTVEDAQQLLGPDEAMAFFLTGEEESYVFALTHDRFDWKVIPLGANALAEKVTAFRHGLDVDALDASIRSGKPDLFDLGLSHELHTSLLGPVDALLKDKKQLVVTPSGVLTSLPFHLLVTDTPAAAKGDGFAAYRDAAWLIKRQAISVLPSVASLKALRAAGNKGNANAKPLIGFGDAVFDPNAAPSGTAKPAARSLNPAYTEFWRGAGIDRSMLSKDLPQLPDTATELKAVAQKLNASASDVHLGRDASETILKAAPLADYRTIYFATHSLVAGDVKGLAEPSLVLSIPQQPSDLDDGLLTASEVSQLKLNADWVVLSACNTVAGGKPGAEALSGLARTFFYAGARALLVSHWAVDSAAATRLTTSTFDILAATPSLGRAEALRQAMLAYLNDASDKNAAYPAFWGPFEIVGEGRATGH
jgi:CHAT domain-containing protein/tetratricopeptide (TPR) repeat protein